MIWSCNLVYSCTTQTNKPLIRWTHSVAGTHCWFTRVSTPNLHTSFGSPPQEGGWALKLCKIIVGAPGAWYRGSHNGIRLRYINTLSRFTLLTSYSESWLPLASSSMTSLLLLRRHHFQHLGRMKEVSWKSPSRKQERTPKGRRELRVWGLCCSYPLLVCHPLVFWELGGVTVKMGSSDQL